MTDQKTTLDATATFTPATDPPIRITLAELPPDVDRADVLEAVRIEVDE